ncbi:hypothetical protein M231_03130 [Tremella mesenterica]|uniref:Mediator of RNA polymerase II transcription subunit 20 n=1 Tax=Tremella mesenterica TaxID=5217 RepID=A0A4Q1BP26_TREME|nr:hypothetical protein M231_03130 [Tremella mesenterica]
MDPTILVQWTCTVPPPTQLVDIVHARILELYTPQLTPLKSSTQIRTFRASFPPSGPRLLSVITHVNPSQPHSQALATKDDTAYLFLDLKPPTTKNRVVDDAGTFIPGETGSEAERHGVDQKEEARYRVLAVRPAENVGPILNNVMSGFVLGLSKAARQAARTTQESVRPTPLPGTTLLLPVLIFPSLSSSHPSISLTIYTVPKQPPTLLLEAHWSDCPDQAMAKAVLHDFIDSLLPPEGQRQTWVWAMEDESGDGKVGKGVGGEMKKRVSGKDGDLERRRWVVGRIGRCLRESEVV